MTADNEPAPLQLTCWFCNAAPPAVLPPVTWMNWGPERAADGLASEVVGCCEGHEVALLLLLGRFGPKFGQWAYAPLTEESSSALQAMTDIQRRAAVFAAREELLASVAPLGAPE